MGFGCDYPRRANGRFGGHVPIKVAGMGLRTALFWDRHVQPHVFRAEPARADRYWNWGTLRLLFPLAQSLKHYRCRALSIFVESGEGRAIPAAMLLFIEHYPHAVNDPAGARSVFIWFIATAPSAALEALGVRDPPSLGRICVDIALVTSQAMGLEGRAWLHCAAKGGDTLLTFYADKCRLHPLPADIVLPVQRMNDGRFFYTSSTLADELINDMDEFRI